MSGDLQSTGRGGAGNIGDATKSPKIQPQDLETPHLKTPVYTTGRGGSGNMANNTNPDEARAAQDVNAITRTVSNSATHVGRGGAANVTKGGEGEAAPAAAAAETPKAKKEGGLLARLKGMLGSK
ncbi:uncharacterized protein B0I36DRAFT_346920 [Microdochium trichocladiopsis]|uniref:Uncharacterized protein n=1 Tax=Microdochium trichocladiopsis TaxID=1682393 RepID=A0A9P8Y8S6_9PEZI|nr:uncharacterized protein B0I36DRAFT_346920 [Microdochium trichocladiopsis]KAH7035074.1 hypothetical protein B0I36DRAFT_346920 [Microdochium trichocladiopsis]